MEKIGSVVIWVLLVTLAKWVKKNSLLDLHIIKLLMLLITQPRAIYLKTLWLLEGELDPK